MLIGNLSASVVKHCLQTLAKYHPVIIDGNHYDSTCPVPDDLNLQSTTTVRPVGGMRAYSLGELFSAINPFSRMNELVALFLNTEKYEAMTKEIFGTSLPFPPTPISPDSILHAELTAFFAILAEMEWVKCSPPYSKDTAVTLGPVKMTIEEWLMAERPFLKMMYVLQLSDRARYAVLAQKLHYTLPDKLPWDTRACEVLHYATVFDDFLRSLAFLPVIGVKNIFDPRTRLVVSGFSADYTNISDWTNCVPRFNRLNMALYHYLQTRGLSEQFEQFQQRLRAASYYDDSDAATFGPLNIPVAVLRDYLRILPPSVIIDGISCSKAMIRAVRFQPQTKLGSYARSAAEWLENGFDNLIAEDCRNLSSPGRLAFIVDLLASPHSKYFLSATKYLTDVEKAVIRLACNELTNKVEDKLPGTADAPKEVADAPKEEVKEVASTPKEEVKEVASTPKEEVKEVASTPKEEVKEVASTPKKVANAPKKVKTLESKKVANAPKKVKTLESKKVANSPKEEVKTLESKEVASATEPTVQNASEPDWDALITLFRTPDYKVEDLAETLDTLPAKYLDEVLARVVTLGWYQAIPTVIDKGANVNHQNWCGDTVLHIALMRGYRNSPLALLEQGADPNLTNHHNETALHCAARMSAQDLIETLLQKGADPTIRNTSGCFPRDLCSNPALIDKYTKPIEIIERRKVMPADFAKLSADSFVRTAELDQATLASLETKMTKK